jgi:hypothetical protein
MKLCIITSTLALLSTKSLVQAIDSASQVSKLGISGWYHSQCDLPTPDLQESCIGDYVPNYEPLALDPTASTCYVNSFVDTTAAAGVQHWFGHTMSQPIKMVFTCIPSCCLEWKELNCTSPPTVQSMGDARVMLLNHFVGTGGMEHVEESGHRVALR